MAIAPVGDLVLDVLKNADPLERAQAQRALKNPARVSADTPVVGDVGSFSNIFAKSVANITGSQVQGGLDTDTPVESLTAMRDTISAAKGPKDLGQQLEAAFLHTLVEAMMPKEMSEVYGGGTSGDMYKSMMAEQLANQIAESGGIGLAEKLMPESLTKQNLKEQA
ncbi:rod-binding protein [Flexibacterium corallicola]|uniref:rod-binding protein n=1 Tax=Flexibacterium corallicola TaxID=3037259 RepID=UPI00286F3418|nr:rod-binding protein [Pseudovibrio sp. M1P-2-3]